MMKKESDRLLAARILSQILQGRGSLSGLLNNCRTEHPAANAALLQELCYGVCRWYYPLDFLCSALLSKPLRARDRELQCLLLIGLYQLLYMRVPAHAAVNETVKAVTQSWARPLVNAVLRKAPEKYQQLLPAIAADFSLKYAHPDWLINQLKASWPLHYQEILAANNERAPMTLRVNPAHYSRAQYLGLLAAENIAAHPGELCENAIILAQPLPVEKLPDFARGAVSVQDQASQLAPGLLQLAPGLRVLDACAAPGGKTCAILEQEPALTQLVALDNDPQRLHRVQENLDRTGLSAQIVCADVSATSSWWDHQPFDRILLDVPCSGTGVINRHPDIKLLRKAGDIEALAQKQACILRALWPLLKPGGLLLYSTCSVLKPENSLQIEHFIQQTRDAKPVLPELGWGLAGPIGRQLLPASGRHDGFYYALLQKC
ncbi:MAG: 16S rRNA (cytosine(967)-C(5))-methyltransferase RsmB [Pseudomonadales bacterium]|nr:16S rRNA (cytosine(967)-C(5))-methyltransferase RsmB [Pseudomonadales bacterium]